MLDTHVWVWWVSGDTRLSEAQRGAIHANRDAGIGVSIISCWEIAMLASLGRLELALPVLEWIEKALAHPGVRLLALTPPIAVSSTQLPEPFHRDPADRILVATARAYGCPLLTSDNRIRGCSFVPVI